MRRLCRLTLATIAIALSVAATAQTAGHLNAYSIEGQFFCVSCHEPLNQVNSPEAQAEKTELGDLVAQGLDMKQIKAKMVEYFGSDVLGNPPAKGFNLLLYVLPPSILVVGLALFGFYLPRWRARARDQAVVETAHAGPPLDPEDAKRLEDELSHFDA